MGRSHTAAQARAARLCSCRAHARPLRRSRAFSASMSARARAPAAAEASVPPQLHPHPLGGASRVGGGARTSKRGWSLRPPVGRCRGESRRRGLVWRVRNVAAAPPQHHCRRRFRTLRCRHRAVVVASKSADAAEGHLVELAGSLAPQAPLRRCRLPLRARSPFCLPERICGLRPLRVGVAAARRSAMGEP